MASPSNRAHETREQRLFRLQHKLRRLDQSAPNYKRERELLNREIQLVKLERPAASGSARATGPANRATATTTTRKTGGGQSKRSASSTATARKKGAGVKSKGLSTEALGGLGKALSPKNIEESLGSIVSLRSFCKQCMKYVQQADTLLDTLFVTGNSLKESGVLSKLAESKGKNLNTSDFTNILMALMNSPMGNNIFKKLGSGDAQTSEEPAATTVTPATARTAATASTPVVRAGQPVNTAAPQAQPRPLPPGAGYPPQ